MDFTPFSVSVTIPAYSPNGTRSCTAFSVVNDEEDEEKEYFTLSIENQSPDIVSVVENTLTIYILDDDSKYYYYNLAVVISHYTIILGLSLILQSPASTAKKF